MLYGHRKMKSFWKKSFPSKVCELYGDIYSKCIYIVCKNTRDKYNSTLFWRKLSVKVWMTKIHQQHHHVVRTSENMLYGHSGFKCFPTHIIVSPSSFCWFCIKYSNIHSKYLFTIKRNNVLNQISWWFDIDPNCCIRVYTSHAILYIINALNFKI